MIVAGCIAAVLPSPIWRQYWLPALPPVFVALALLWTATPPRRWLRLLTAVFVGAGLAPSIVAVAAARRHGDRDPPGRRDPHDDGRGGRDRPGRDAVARNSSPATARAIDPRFATGPFYFRSHGLLDAADEAARHLVSRARLADAPLPPTRADRGRGILDQRRPRARSRCSPRWARSARLSRDLASAGGALHAAGRAPSITWS